MLKKELYGLLRTKGELTFNDLEKWMNEKDIGYLLLYAIVEELSKEPDIVLSEERIIIDFTPDLSFTFPSKISIKKQKAVLKKTREESREIFPLRPQVRSFSKPSRRRTEKTKRHRVRGKVIPLLEIARQEAEAKKERPKKPLAREEAEKVEEARQVKFEETKLGKAGYREITVETSVKEPEKVISRPEPETIEEESAERILDEFDEDMKRAIVYLNHYWSVGTLRFMQDLKKIGVKDPDELMVRLAEMGFIEVVPEGVINATSKLPKVKRRITLADLFMST
ncbi:MAG: hypothetical protein DRJ52_05400 [Thermoprotei archaeon]|nr:MAG: hypothetical protein DRJ52_05400 [Thermoprotei archaeon]